MCPSLYEIIKIKQKKTGNIVMIPVHSVVKAMLKKYNGLPRSISGQKLNEHIKEACKIVGISQRTIQYYNQAGINKSTIKPKYELISTHTARRSFATNAIKAGIPSMEVMKITGHKSEAAFKRYICIDDEESAIRMAANPFFS